MGRPIVSTSDGDVVQMGLDGGRIYLGSVSGDTRTFDVASGREIDSLPGHHGQVTALALSRGGRLFASGGLDRIVRIRELVSGRSLTDLPIPGDRIHTLSFSPDGSLLAGSITPEDRVVVWDVTRRSQRSVLAGHKGLIPGLNFSPDGSMLASASWDGTARLWDTASGQLIASLRAQLLGVNSVDFTQDGRRLAAGTGDGFIKLWNLENLQEVLTLRGAGGVGIVRFLSGDETLVGASPEAIELWVAPSLGEISRKEHLRAEEAVVSRR